MNWIRENKFLAGFFAALIVGVAILGWLLFSASGSFSEVSENYEKQARELKRLQNLAPYPDEKNLAKLREQKDNYIAQMTDLQKSLATIEFAEQPMTPEQFQDKLRASVSKITERATSANVHLPPNFYLGFDTPTNYQTTLPKASAAPALGRELQAIEFLVSQLIDNKIDTLTALVRPPLPQEAHADASSSPAPGVPAPRGRGGAEGEKQQLVGKIPLTLGFIVEQSRFRKWLNDIASAKEQFFIVRMLAIKNESEKGPSRLENPEAAAAAAPAVAPSVDGEATAPGASPTPAPLKFIVGNEKVIVTAKIEIVDFAPPAPAGK